MLIRFMASICLYNLLHGMAMQIKFFKMKYSLKALLHSQCDQHYIFNQKQKKIAMEIVREKNVDGILIGSSK